MNNGPILVTGAAGLIGFAVAKRLESIGKRVVGMDLVEPSEDVKFPFVRADLTDLHKLYKVVSSGIGGIIHCGAVSGPMLFKDNPYAIVQSNIVGSANVFEAARNAKLARVVYCSSTSAYGDHGPNLKSCDESTALDAVDIYGASKASGDILGRAYAAQHGLDFIALRFSWVYGPRRQTDCLIRDLLLDALNGRESRYAFGTNFARQYVYIHDVVDATLAAYEIKNPTSRVFNITGGTRLNFAEIAETIKSVIPAANIINNGSEGADLYHAPMDISAAKQVLGWEPKWSLQTGCADYMDWLKK